MRKNIALNGAPVRWFGMVPICNRKSFSRVLSLACVMYHDLK